MVRARGHWSAYFSAGALAIRFLGDFLLSYAVAVAIAMETAIAI